jgi:hypothetical protein
VAVFVCQNWSQNQSPKTCAVLGFGTISGFDFVNRGLQSDIQPTHAGKVRFFFGANLCELYAYFTPTLRIAFF